jgi:hypothetical protein
MLNLIHENEPEIKANSNVIPLDISVLLYIYKTIIASALGNQMQLPNNPNKSQKNYSKILKNTIKHTKWVIEMYHIMNHENSYYISNQIDIISKSKEPLKIFQHKLFYLRRG